MTGATPVSKTNHMAHPTRSLRSVEPTRPCRACDGSGIWYSTYRYRDALDTIDTPCRPCDGTGEVELTEEEQAEAAAEAADRAYDAARDERARGGAL